MRRSSALEGRPVVAVLKDLDLALWQSFAAWLLREVLDLERLYLLQNPVRFHRLVHTRNPASKVRAGRLPQTESLLELMGHCR